MKCEATPEATMVIATHSTKAMEYLKFINTQLQRNLTTFHKTELWLSRTCLTLAILVIAPTLLLVFCDLLLWVFRASEVQERTGELVTKTREGVSTLVRKKSNGPKEVATDAKSLKRRDSASSVDSLMSSVAPSPIQRDFGKLTPLPGDVEESLRQRKDITLSNTTKD
jgi:small-conductance mechanosensitive channel